MELVSNSDYTAFNERINKLERMWKEAVMASSCHLLGGTEESHEKAQSGKLYQLRFKPHASQIQVRGHYCLKLIKLILNWQFYQIFPKPKLAIYQICQT
jgi:hypothetical protein